MRELLIGAGGFIFGLLFMEVFCAFPARQNARHYFDRMVIYQRALSRIRINTEEWHDFYEAEEALKKASELLLAQSIISQAEKGGS